MRKQVRSIMCGCGECATRLVRTDTCPVWNSKEAIQLWHTDPNDLTGVEETVLEQVADILEDLNREPQELTL
jgi:hypothetical protein